jgi:hypothetical protein
MSVDIESGLPSAQPPYALTLTMEAPAFANGCAGDAGGRRRHCVHQPPHVTWVVIVIFTGRMRVPS